MMGKEGDQNPFVWSRRKNNKIGERRDQWTAFSDLSKYQYSGVIESPCPQNKQKRFLSRSPLFFHSARGEG